MSSLPVSLIVGCGRSAPFVLPGGGRYTAGRESNTTYNESLAGARVPGWAGVHGPQGIDALRPDGTLLKYVYNLSELAAPGTADDALMAFQHRMCISGDEDRVPWPKPEGYNPDDFLLMQRAIDATGNADSFTSMPPGAYHGYPGPKKKYDLCCGITIAASDQPTINKGWANASWERRLQIVADHTYFELGTFYYIANDPKVPVAVRKQFQQYGLCRDEFVDNGYLPWQLYVRISNRMVGDFVLTQNNICQPRRKPNSIAVGDWYASLLRAEGHTCRCFAGDHILCTRIFHALSRALIRGSVDEGSPRAYGSRLTQRFFPC